MSVFNSLKVRLVNVAGKDYSQLTFVDMGVPSYISDFDYYLVERIDIPLTDATAIYNSYLATATQSVLYYMSGNTYMSANIYMGGYDLGYASTYIDVTKQVSAGISVVVDSTSDPTMFMHIYRAIALNVDGNNLDESATPYVMLVSTSSLSQTETVIQEKPRYRVDKTGETIILGIPGIHATPRHNGPIESSAYRGVINSLRENDTMVAEQSEALWEELTVLLGALQTVGLNMGRIIHNAQARDILDMSFNDTMGEYVYMSKHLFMTKTDTEQTE